MRTLVIGGSVFLGRAIVEEALRRGHEVTTFNRGVSGQDLPGVEAVRGNRESPEDLARLAEGREWDAVVDVCGFVPRVVGDSVRALNGRAATYAFISSISACSGWPGSSPTDESTPRFDCAPDAGPEDGDYGVLKAGCERAVEQGFDGNALIIEPGLILGPHENVGRLPWWLTRIARGGKVLAPGDPEIAMQLIDARDIAAFTLSQAEAGTADRFFVSGVEGNATYRGLLQECRAVTGSDAEFVWVDDRFLLDREVQPWTELPVWAPRSPEFAGVWLPSSAKARAAGLTCRPVAETVRDTWAWLRDIPVERRSFGTARMSHGIDPDKEAEILAAWEGEASPAPA
ncbi:NAD-dependent epimerase/dehydratase family protein [Planobispora longispora]|uniref:Reductase n=1 Tax=Planobispora longispora TaxID=28887 RepID=A0A8J3W4L9_9ACTN|nr:NAD-dependent epimerase/dehydratase family protein [Planobispora longispora]GIH76564.1 reductase [Planobispora longispora]